MSRRKSPACTWGGEAWTGPTGEACNQDHCAMRGRCPNHVRHDAGIVTCANCIQRTRRDLDDIVLRYALLGFDAQVDGIESEAMNLIGHAAAPEQYAERRARLRALYERQGWCDWPRSEAFRADDPHHPYAVLSRWELALEDAGWLTRSDMRITVTSAAIRLRGLLDRTFPHGDEFEAFAREIAACLAHLEAVDHDERQADLGRPCPTCVAENDPAHPAPRLRKRYARHAWARPGQRCADPTCAACAGKLDAWHCPDNPAHAWTDADYRLRVDADYVQHAAALTASQLQQRFGVKPGTIRAWALRGKVRKHGLDQLGRQLYDVADVAAHSA